MAGVIEGLNVAQREAVAYTGGPLLIVAGAGTGKTTVLTRRIAWLLETGLAQPSEVLALTFTERAAGELEERLDRLLPYGTYDVTVATFHGFCEKLLRDEGGRIGLGADFRVVTPLDAWLLLRRHMERLPLAHYKPMGNPLRYVRHILTHIAQAKDEGVTTDAYEAWAQAFTHDDPIEIEKARELASVYRVYQEILKDEHALDFGDLLLLTKQVLERFPDVLTRTRTRYKHVLVDEFQDTNSLQYELTRMIAAPANNLTVVGDDDQSIYRFRGASLANILRFEEDYPTAKRVVLLENYRSGQAILDTAYHAITQNNPRRLEAKSGLCKKLSSNVPVSGDVRICAYSTETEEIAGVVSEILSLKERDASLRWDDIAILVRANADAEPYVAALDSAGVPYQFFAMRGLYTKPVVLDICAWFRFIDQAHDSVSAYRALAHPTMGFSNEEIHTMLYEANRQGVSLFQVLTQGTSDSAERAREIYERLVTLSRTAPVTELCLTLVRDTGLLAFWQGLPEETAMQYILHLRQWMERLKRYTTTAPDPLLHGFLEEFREERQVGEEGALQFDPSVGPEMVKILTIHAAKGLEFRYVFVVSMIEQRFPSVERKAAIPLPEAFVQPFEKEGSPHTEEERRLFYVALTRAKEGIYLTWAEDYGGARKRRRSRFLDEIAGHVNVQPPSHLEPSVQHLTSNAQQTITIPKAMSFTQLAAYKTCPLQYKFAHVLRIPVFGKPQFSYGKTLHTVLEHFGKEWLKTGSLPGTDLLMELCERYWVPEWYPDEKVEHLYRERAQKSLAQFHEAVTKEPLIPMALEQPFSMKVGSVIIRGQMDWVSKIGDGLAIIDFKTGEGKELKDLRKEDKWQLLLYQRAAEELFKLPVRSLTLWYVDGGSRVSFTPKEGDFEDLTEAFENTAKSIGTSQFSATPGFHCQFCDFADICEFRS